MAIIKRGGEDNDVSHKSTVPPTACQCLASQCYMCHKARSETLKLTGSDELDVSG